MTFRYDTAHASKGQEADCVIVLDVNGGRFGWPSQREEDSLLQLVFPDEEPHPCAEEWWPFYVAVTRACHHTYLLSDIGEPSKFVQEMLDGHHTDCEFHYLVIEGSMQEQATVVPCSRCGGSSERKSSSSGECYGCRTYPYCAERASRCKRCRTRPLMRQTYAYVSANTACGHTQHM